VAVLVLLVGAVGAHAKLVPCHRAGDVGQIADALGRIRRSVDPCGESAQIRALLHELERCTRARYEICTDTTATRNLFDRAAKTGSERSRGTPSCARSSSPAAGTIRPGT
jgi:hypothetical protein